MKKLLLILCALSLVASFTAGCSQPLPSPEELSEKKTADDEKRADDSDSDSDSDSD
jgi:hypothetical protein